MTDRPSHGTQSYHSTNLYQLFAYVKNARMKGPNYEGAEGMLLYPTVAIELDETFSVQGHRLHACTIDLGQPWADIRSDLLQLIERS